MRETNPSTNQASLFESLPRYTTRLIEEQRVPYHTKTFFSGPESVVDILKQHFKGKDREEFVVMFLNTNNMLLGFEVVSIGGIASSIVEPRAVFKAAILINAASIICGHNHPSGNITASREDIRVTRVLRKAGTIMGIPVLDHVIIGDGYTSFAENGLLE